MEFQLKGMGPVIGTRSWGGLVGVSMLIEMIDGGGLTAPDYRIYDPIGKWVVENEGVRPDIVVDLDPVEMSRGYDAQLMKGIEVLMQEDQGGAAPVADARTVQGRSVDLVGWKGLCGSSAPHSLGFPRRAILARSREGPAETLQPTEARRQRRSTIFLVAVRPPAASE